MCWHCGQLYCTNNTLGNTCLYLLGLQFYEYIWPLPPPWYLQFQWLWRRRGQILRGDGAEWLHASGRIQNNVAAFALAEHALMAGYGIDLSKTEVLDSNPYIATRCMLESWHIQHNENKLNRERGNLPEVYAAQLD